MSAKKTEPDFSTLASLQVQVAALEAGVERAQSELQTAMQNELDATGRIAGLKALIPDAEQKSKDALKRIPAIEAARRQHNRVHPELKSSRKSINYAKALDDAQAALDAAQGAAARTEAQVALHAAKRAHEGHMGALAHFDQRADDCRKVSALWTEAAEAGIPGDIERAEDDHAQAAVVVAEKRARLERARHAVEVVSEQISKLSYTLCESHIGAPEVSP